MHKPASLNYKLTGLSFKPNGVIIDGSSIYTIYFNAIQLICLCKNPESWQDQHFKEVLWDCIIRGISLLRLYSEGVDAVRQVRADGFCSGVVREHVDGYET